MLRRLIQSVTFHPYVALAVLVLGFGPFDNCPLR
jgi:hypothetical protein